MRHTYRQAGIQVSRQRDILADRKMDKQAGRESHRQAVIHVIQANMQTRKQTYLQPYRQAVMVMQTGTKSRD